MDEDVIVRREERGLISVLTMEYRPYNLLGPTLIGAIAAEITGAREAGSRAIVLRSGLRHFSAGADVNLFDARIEQGGRREAAISGVDFLKLLERERLLGGNWKIRPAAGLYFKRQWCAVVDEVPADLDVVRYWDLAATEKTELNDPDWTIGIKLGRDKNRGYWVLDVVRARANPGDVERLLLNTASQDGKRVRIGFGKDPGQAGKSQALHLVRAMSAFTVAPATESGDKLTRFGPFSAQCRAGNVKILRGPWNEDLFRVLEGFPDLAHDDEVDACSGALEMLNPEMKGAGIYEFYRRKAEEPRAEQHGNPQPSQTAWAPGSMEWLAEQNKSS
jgi:predicted phage terminase large subunit-like protein